jgi:hypothetical protein
MELHVGLEVSLDNVEECRWGEKWELIAGKLI